MIDHVNEVIPGEKSTGYKELKFDEWFFKVHWENDPNMPGMLQIEALVQMCSMAIYIKDGLKVKLLFFQVLIKLNLKKNYSW